MRVLCRTFLAFPIAIFVVLTLFIVLVLESRRNAPRWVESGSPFPQDHQPAHDAAGEDLSFQDTQQQWRSWRTK
jgi:hypothetical protein